MRETTTPPEAKTATATGAAVSGVIAQLTELAVAVCATWVLSVGKLDQDNWMIIMGAVVIGPAIGKARGMVPVSSLATVAAILPVVLKGKTLL